VHMEGRSWEGCFGRLWLHPPRVKTQDEKGSTYLKEGIVLTVFFASHWVPDTQLELWWSWLWTWAVMWVEGSHAQRYNWKDTLWPKRWRFWFIIDLEKHLHVQIWVTSEEP
jgi:hypothetical protein